MKNTAKLVISIAFTLVVSGCAIKNIYNNEDYYSALKTKLKHITKAVHTVVKYEDTSKYKTDRELIEYSQGKDTLNLRAFDDYEILVSKTSKGAILLVCTKDKTTAIFEDAGCTDNSIDKSHYLNKNTPCTFTLDISVCTK